MNSKTARKTDQGPAGVADTRIVGYTKLPAPGQVHLQFPNNSQELINRTRAAIHGILAGDDDRLLAVVGPCSVHNPAEALEYARLLRGKAEAVSADLLVVMRVYFEKPRTTVGWKGLINDPGLDGSFDISRGIAVARELLMQINEIGVPCGTEFLDTVIPQYIADTVSWGAIGARTTESQVHRELASGLSCPVGFKNGTAGAIDIAASAVLAAASPHHFPAVDIDGTCSIAATTGNKDAHIILRGGSDGPNYDPESVAAAAAVLDSMGLPARLMIDCSHANSGKDHRRQPDVAASIAQQVGDGGQWIIGAMIESNLVEGSQRLEAGKDLVPGQSVTDACLGWDDTCDLLDTLAAGVRRRRGG